MPNTDFGYSLLASHPWALTLEALQSLVEWAHIHATAGLAPQAALPTNGRSAPRAGAVGIIPVRGLIKQHQSDSFFDMLFGGTSVDGIKAAINEALNDDSISSIVLDIDSPGGSSYGMTELAAFMRQARRRKPIIAVANSVAASGSFWLGGSANTLFATPGAVVGSVGVYVLHLDVSKMAEEAGIKATFVSAGKYKTEGNQFEPLTDEATAHVQSLVDDTYTQFIHDLALGRGTSDANVRRNYGEGRVLTATAAKAAGMVDDIKTLEEAIAYASRARVEAEPAAAQQAEAITPEEPDQEVDGEAFKRLGTLRLADMGAKQSLVGRK